MADIAEQLCLAIDEIVSKRLEGINYDTTIVATIVDNKEAEKNKYVCSNGSSQFVAYSKDVKYNINDSVQVTIPNNDYSQQKFIVGRYITSNEDLPYNYSWPFSTIVDVSSNLAINAGSKIYSLLANENYDKNNNTFITEVPIWSETFEEMFSNFNRLGIRGSFRSWISNLKPVEGDYGYRLEVISNNGVTIETNQDVKILKNWSSLYSDIINQKDYNASGLMEATPESWYLNIKQSLETLLKEKNLDIDLNITKQSFIETFENELDPFSKVCQTMVYAFLLANGQVQEMYLSSYDMYGDPYNFQSFFEQEKVFDISSIKNIIGMSLFFYQKSNTFVDKDNVQIPYKGSAFASNFMDNLFTQEPYVCLGYNLAEFDKEQAIIYTIDSDTYVTKDGVDPNLNKKTIRLRWLHQFENGQIKVITEASDIGEYEVRWYRFKLGAASADKYSGVYWERVEPDEASIFSYTFTPQVNTSQEQIKAIVLHNNNVIRSNIMTFTNESPVVDLATVEMLAGLSIWCQDDSYGNYCLYGQNNNLLNESKTNEVLTLEAHFADNSLLAEEYDVDQSSAILTEAKEIIWEFSLNNSMIIVDGFNYSFTYENDEINADDSINYPLVFERDKANKGQRYKLPGHYEDAEIQVKGNSIFIIRVNENKDNPIYPYQEYRIKRTLNASSINNTVKCAIKKDGIVYSAVKDFTFGLMGTNGTDATLVIDFNNNKTALTASLQEEALKVTARLYNYDHTEMDFNRGDLNLNCEWSWKYYKEFDQREEERIKEEAYNNYLINHPEAINTLTSEQIEKIKQDGLIAASTVKIVTSESEASNVCFITHNETLDLVNKKFFLILEAKVTGYGDYDLITYKAVPIRKDPSFRYIIGPTEVIYNSSGYADYYKDPYQLYWSGGVENVNQYDMVIDETQIASIASHWQIYDPYAETTNETESRFIGNVSSSNILKPASVYVKGANPYGVVCYSNIAGAYDDSNICWIQPLVIMQNQYPSTTLNKWNGKSVEIDEENGTIVSPAIASGKKNQDNTFSGVMIGDWSNADVDEGGTASEITAQTGIYGFNHGAMSFAFTDDGTAFIGKSGRGRIEFNGNTGILKSSNWTDTKKSGMHLDLDDGILKLQRDPGYDQIYLSAEDYQPNTYYILNGTYLKVPHNTKFGEDFTYSENGGGTYDCNTDTVYYKSAIVEHGYITTSAEFDKLKSGLYVKSRATYTRCKKEDVYAYEIIYYEPTFSAAGTLTQAKFNNNKEQRFYTLQVNGTDQRYYTYKLAGSTFNSSTTYYVMDYLTTTTCAEEFNGNANKNFYIQKNDATLGIYYELAPSNFTDFTGTQLYEVAMIRSYLNYDYQYNYDPEFYFTKGEDSYIKVTSGFRLDLMYYKMGYMSQNYAYQIPDISIWNQFKNGASLDPNLKSDEFYYTYLENFILATGAFDASQTYYKDNKADSNAARYITLSAAASRFPLAIGNDSNEQARKFKVEWDGTCWIEDGVFSGDITANTGTLYDLTLHGQLSMSSYGSITSGKRHLYDFVRSGFWLDSDGLNIGNDDNYILATTDFSGFYNNRGAVKVSGIGLDIFPNLSADNALSVFRSSNELSAAIHLGWSDKGTSGWSYPYLRFGMGGLTDYTAAGLLKKFGAGMWIGSYGANVDRDSPENDSTARVGIFCHEADYGSGISPTVYRCETINGQRVFEPARYARFA